MLYKRIVFFLFCLSGIYLVGCQKDKDLVFEESANVRSAKLMEKMRTTIQASEHGWVAYMFTTRNNGYTFYFDFINGHRVNMYGDFNDETLYEKKESSYSLKNVGIPSIIFDTYNHLHILADPDNSINGGSRGDGMYTDFEFGILELHDDEIVLEGVFNNNKMVLRKASAAEKAVFEEGTFKTFKQSVEDFTVTNPFLYMTEEGSADPVTFNLNLSERSITFSYYDEEGTVNESKMGIALGIDNILLEKPFELGDASLSEINLREDVMEGIDKNGGRFNIRKDSNPLESLFERLETQRYNFFQLKKNNQIGAFGELYNRVFDRVLDGGREILHAEFKIKSADTLTLDYRYVSSKEYSAFKDYRIVFADDNTVQFEDLPAGGSSGSYSNYSSFVTRAEEMHEFLISNTFELDYYTDIINGTIQTLARFKSIENPDHFILFNIE